jgi:C4-type Zn-finger protein
MADNIQATANSPKNSTNNSVLIISECQCCSFRKSDVQALENEVKSMSEIINILRDELKCVYTSNGGSRTISTYAEKLKN